MSRNTLATRRLAAAAAVGLGTLGLAAIPVTSASAEPATRVSFEVGSYPIDAYWDGVGTNTNKDTGYYYGDYSGPTDVATRTEQVRGGTVISYDGSYADAAHTKETPISVVAGDVIRIVRRDTGALVSQTTFAGTPVLAATTCVGSPAFAGTRTAGAAVNQVQLRRRISRTDTNTGPYGGPGTPRQTNAFETVAFASPETISGTAFSGALPTPVKAGDQVEVSEYAQSVVNDVATSTYTDITRAAAACPAPVAAPGVPTPAPAPGPAADKTAPTASKIKGKATKRASFLKSGLTTTLTVNEAGTVKQALYLPNGAKVPTKVLAKKKTKKKAILVGKGSKTTKTAGKVTIKIRPTAAGKKALKKRKSYTLKLVTTVRDAAGNARSKTVTLKIKR